MKKIDTKDGRYYELNGDKYPSVTTIISKGLPKPALISWAGKFVAETAVFDETWLDMDTEQAVAYLSGAPDRKRNKSANLGSSIHAAAEAYALGQPLKKAITEQAQSYVNGFQKFLLDFSPRYLYTEATVFSTVHRYAGTLDALVQIDRTIWIIDTKTGNRVYPDTALQLAAYANADLIVPQSGEPVNLPSIRKGGILHLSPDNYSFIPTRIDDEVFNTFLSVKDLWRWSFELANVVMREPIVK